MSANPRDSSPRPGSADWRREWVVATAASALFVTTFDSLLLQRRSSLFTGGFLSVDHLKGPGEIVVFLAGSLVTDAGLTAGLAAVGLAVAALLGLGRPARRILCGAVAAGPLVVSNVVAYRVFEYLGSAFDLGLMFDLVGRRPAEIWAVADAHLLRLAALCGGGVAVVALAVWAVQRACPGDGLAWRAARPGWRTSVGAPMLVALVGLGASTGLRLERESLDNGLRRKPSGKVFGAVVSAVSDVDGDGYGLLQRPADPAPSDGRVHPYAVDWPGNGLDEDGVGGDLPADWPAYEEDRSAAPRWPDRPDVVLFVLESVRADVVGATVDGRPVTPVIDGLARRGASATRAYSLNGYTVQSRFHVLSGSLANLRGGTTLIDDFNANGYETACFSGQDESFGGGELPAGFERAAVFYDARQDRTRRYSTFATPGSLAVPHQVVLERIREFLSTRRRDRPLFLYVNFHDAHFPYHHAGIRPLVGATVLERGDIGPGRRQELWRMYLNTVANIDRAVGEVIAGVAEATGREPAVIVTADHGESLYDEGFLGHGYALDEAQTRVPLIAAGLPLVLREPWGHADLRDGVRAALAAWTPGSRPIVVASEPREVFQYLGVLDRPAQIAFTSAGGRSIFDFREGRFRMPGGPWMRPAETEGATREAFLRLVRFWESVVVARTRVEAAGS